jgi:hypothetical protein
MEMTISTAAARWIDPEALIYPGCGEPVRCQPPDTGVVADFSHAGGTPLCRTRGGAPAELVEVWRCWWLVVGSSPTITASSGARFRVRRHGRWQGAWAVADPGLA